MRSDGGPPDAEGILVSGSPGSGNTVLGLQIPAGAIADGEGALLIPFEESCEQILRDAGSCD